MPKRFQLTITTAAVAAILSSIFAASAFGEEKYFFSEVSPTTVTGTATAPLGTFNDELTTDWATLKCIKTTYQGTLHSTISSVMYLAPTFSGCSVAGLSATVNANGCEFMLRSPYSFPFIVPTMDILCPKGKEITATAPSVGTTKCTIHIPPQNGIGDTVEYKTLGSGATREIRAEVVANFEVKYSLTKGTSESGNCTTSDNTTNGTFRWAAVLTGESGWHVGIFVA